MMTRRRSAFASRACCWFATFVLAHAAAAGIGVAEQGSMPQLFTNEAMVVDVTRPVDLDLKNPMAVLAYVLRSLPPRVTVYPTENYYYFKFVHAGVPIAGNFRFDPRSRDQGKVYFGYYEDYADWRGDGFEQPADLDSSRDVTIERVRDLLYRVTYQGITVEFALNDLSQVRPPSGLVGPNERFIGPVFDESGVQFFLVYNSKAKVFHFILDETRRTSDQLDAMRGYDRILIGKRTGFAYYRDHRIDRKILIGAFEPNVRLNTYFDGPFDQLPENFIEGETLREAIIDVEPELSGKIDRLGHFEGDEARFAIMPYMAYRTPNDLTIFHRCATDRRVAPAAYYRCFAIGNTAPGRVGRPLALTELGRRSR
jgi:hypothetical protein